MKPLFTALAVGSILLSSAGSAAAQPDRRDYDGRGVEHPGWGHDHGDGRDWRRGERMGYDDWNGAARIDYRRRHLRHPPRGYEWREVNGRYVLAAIATGVIASIIINGGR